MGRTERLQRFAEPLAGNVLSTALDPLGVCWLRSWTLGGKGRADSRVGGGGYLPFCSTRGIAPQGTNLSSLAVKKKLPIGWSGI